MSALLSPKELEILPYRGRDLLHLEKFFGSISAFLPPEHSHPLRILELGCGYGQVLVDLAILLGSDVELHGINRYHADGNIDTLLRVAQFRGLPEADIERIKPERILIRHVDVKSGLPYPDAFFDLIVSQLSIVYVVDKARLLEEVSRVLAVSGNALLHTQFFRPELPEPYNFSFDVYNGDRRIPFGEFFRTFTRFRHRETEAGSTMLIRGGGVIHLPVILTESIDYSTLGDIRGSWYGTRSIYSTGAILA